MIGSPLLSLLMTAQSSVLSVPTRQVASSSAGPLVGGANFFSFSPDEKRLYVAQSDPQAPIWKVFNLDMQAVGDSFLLSTLESMGLDVVAIEKTALTDRDRKSVV